MTTGETLGGMPLYDEENLLTREEALRLWGHVTRECLAAIPDASISGRRVARELTALIERRGNPGMIVSDNGTELSGNTILQWCSEHRIEWHNIAPGKPMRTASSRVSAAASATSCSMRPCSGTGLVRAS